MSLAQKTIGTSNTTLFTSIGETACTTIHLCNHGVSDDAFNLYFVKSGSVASTANVVYIEVPLTAKNTYVIDQEKVLFGPGDAIVAKCNTGTIACTISYTEI